METISFARSAQCADFQYIVVRNGKEILFSTSGPRYSYFVKELGFLHELSPSVYSLSNHLKLICLEGEQQAVESKQWLGLRDLLSLLDASSFRIASLGVQTAYWLQMNRYCGQCGNETSQSRTESCLECSTCNFQIYPKISPCVIGLVTRGEQFILARGARHPQGLFSTLAGFIELSENAEQAFAREVEEEVGIKIKGARYVGSQSWPFPAQLMLGFEAEYESGVLQPDGVEIIEAAWFSADNLPTIPPESTISGQIIRNFLQRIEGKAFRG